MSCIRWVVEIPFNACTAKGTMKRNISFQQEINIVQLGIANQAELKLLLRYPKGQNSKILATKKNKLPIKIDLQSRVWGQTENSDNDSRNEVTQVYFGVYRGGDDEFLMSELI
uniref:Uncharacterized protein n=1 Tax=Tanacetum cinerariifolium TaxID=118510 RepID=A0A6L2LQ39_TANCI|nr:hypothetical protein [Tanacetum cinerariifolium]